ncbi:hypothetical protein RIF29_19262 [Crotalaria pallida]|uniref:Uncharacterized protein n=1 Tax=Crotalaria pallida TaxID=3830 RepID=A0AAN9F7H9_CROPI
METTDEGGFPNKRDQGCGASGEDSGAGNKEEGVGPSVDGNDIVEEGVHFDDSEEERDLGLDDAFEFGLGGEFGLGVEFGPLVDVGVVGAGSSDIGDVGPSVAVGPSVPVGANVVSGPSVAAGPSVPASSVVGPTPSVVAGPEETNGDAQNEDEEGSAPARN